MIVATDTRTVLFCKSEKVGQVVLYVNSLYVSFKYAFNFSILNLVFARVVRFELTTFGFGDHCSTS